MAQYTVIVDDSYEGITYGPGPDDWSSTNVESQFNYQGTAHFAQTPNARLAFPFTGGQQVVVSGSFVGDNSLGNLTTYPIFQVDSTNLNCTPNPPENGGQFLCSASLPLDNVNRTLTMFLPPDVSGQPYHIDYIRYGSNSQEVKNDHGTALFIQSPLPSSNTTGLTFDGDWNTNKDLGHANDVQYAAQTSIAQSKVTLNFLGSSIAWWNCCMPPETPGNTASGSYSIDGSDDVTFQIDSSYLQGPQCKDEIILFQTNQLQDGNHTMVVTYNGDNTKMPLTLCALAATPLSFENLDPSPQGSHINGSKNSDGHDHDDSSSSAQRSTRSIPIFAIVIIAVVGTALVASMAIFLCRRRQKRRWQRLANKRSSQESLVPFTLHPWVGGIPPEKRVSAIFGPSAESKGPSGPGATTVPPVPSPPDEVQQEQATPFEAHPDGGESRPHTMYSDEGSQSISTRPPSYRTTGTGERVPEVPLQ